MRIHSKPFLAAVLVAVLGLSPLCAQSPGPDVIVGDLPDIDNYGTLGGISAFAVGTTSCNVGTAPLSWVGSNNNHPVIAQNLYRLKNGRFEQVGMSWLKHGFTALAQNLCSPCQNPGTGSLLGVGCSDPYVASLNGSQIGLGPRSEVNASTGAFPFPFGGAPPTNLLSRRLQVNNDDLNPAMNPGARYFVEGHYIAADDAAAGNANNNASYREVNVAQSGPGYNLTFAGPTQRQKPGILAWQDADPSVTINYVDFPNDGRFIVARKDIPVGGGRTRYEFAVQNLNSDRSAESFTVTLPPGGNVTNVGFRDVFYHSGEPYDGTDWTPSVAANGVSWATTPYAVNPNANALRWATMYSFWFESSTAPIDTAITLFKPEPCPPQPTWPPIITYALVTNAPYDFVNIAAIGSPGPTLDDSSVLATLPFAFPFFDTTLNQIRISSNGYLTMPNQDGTIFQNAPIPTAGPPDGFIAGFWTDLNPSSGGSIRYATVGSAPNRRFVVDYSNVPHYPSTGSYSFQITLEEDGTITSTIVSVTSGGSNATRGVEAPNGQSGTQGSFNQPGSAPSTSTWRYVRQSAVPTSANLTLTGSGAPNTLLQLRLISTPNRPLYIGADNDFGPASLGAFGSIELGFSAGFVTIADGIGLFGPANPFAITDACGVFTIGGLLGPMGLPSGFNYNFQAIVPDSNAPNQAFHISNSVNLNIP